MLDKYIYKDIKGVILIWIENTTAIILMIIPIIILTDVRETAAAPHAPTGEK